MSHWLLPHLPKERILARFAAAPGNEIERGKLASPESSAALAANTFGYFIDRPAEFPLAAMLDFVDEIPTSICLERELRFPWNGGRHPWLDAVIETPGWLIGIESKRYEPFRAGKMSSFSDAYARDVWGDMMGPYTALRAAIADGSYAPRHLDAAQLVKHAFGIRTQADKKAKKGALVYLHAEPTTWPDGRTIDRQLVDRHRAEIQDFADRVAGTEVTFATVRYADLFQGLHSGPLEAVRQHAAALTGHFQV